MSTPEKWIIIHNMPTLSADSYRKRKTSCFHTVLRDGSWRTGRCHSECCRIHRLPGLTSAPLKHAIRCTTIKSMMARKRGDDVWWRWFERCAESFIFPSNKFSEWCSKRQDINFHPYYPLFSRDFSIRPRSGMIKAMLKSPSLGLFRLRSGIFLLERCAFM